MDARPVERTERVYLDAGTARCEPSRHCSTRSHCARYLAAIPGRGAVMTDCSLDPFWTPSLCLQYIPASKCTRPDPPRPTPKRRHWDHDDG